METNNSEANLKNTCSIHNLFVDQYGLKVVQGDPSTYRGEMFLVYLSAISIPSVELLANL